MFRNYHQFLGILAFVFGLSLTMFGASAQSVMAAGVICEMSAASASWDRIVQWSVSARLTKIDGKLYKPSFMLQKVGSVDIAAVTATASCTNPTDIATDPTPQLFTLQRADGTVFAEAVGIVPPLAPHETKVVTIFFDISSKIQLVGTDRLLYAAVGVQVFDRAAVLIPEAPTLRNSQVTVTDSLGHSYTTSVSLKKAFKPMRCPASRQYVVTIVTTGQRSTAYC